MIQSGQQSFKPDIFTIGINCININEKDDNGYTLLMIAVKSALLPAVKLLLAKETLHVNRLSGKGLSALNLLFLDWAFLFGDPSTVWSDMVNLFLEREAVANDIKDIDFGHIKVQLLVHALEENLLYLASSLLDSSTYHPSPSELATARDMLLVGKRVLLTHHHKEDSAEKKVTMLTLLYKLEMKKRQHDEKGSESQRGRK